MGELAPYAGPDIQEIVDVGDVANWRPISGGTFGIPLDFSEATLDAALASERARIVDRRMRMRDAEWDTGGINRRMRDDFVSPAVSQVSFAPEVQVFPQRPR